MQNNSNNLELNKFPGFDILENLPEEEIINTYNQEYYDSVNSYKGMSLPPYFESNLLFYNYQHNENAPITTSTIQILNTYEELVKSNIETKEHIYKIKNEIEELKEQIAIMDKDFIEIYLPETKQMMLKLQHFLADQRTENFKLIKEISVLEKDKNELNQAIYLSLQRLAKLEKIVGVKTKAFTYLFEQSFQNTLKDKENKFVLEKENI